MKSASVALALMFALAAGSAAANAAAQDEVSLLQKYKTLEPVIQKAQKLLDGNKRDQCLSELGSCTAVVPDHHLALYLEAQVLYKRGEFVEAYDRMVKARAGYLRLAAAIQKFQSEKLLRQMSDAQDRIDLAPELEKDLAKTSCRQAILTGQILENDKSLNATKRETQKDLTDRFEAVPAEYDYFSGNCLFKLKRYDEAAVSYASAIASDPAHVSANNNLINLLFTAGRFEEARAHIRQAEAAEVKINPALKKAVLAAGK